MTFRDDDDFHASVFILGPNNTTVLIRDGRKLLQGLKPLWKFPGGKRRRIEPFLKPRRDEQPVETVIREVREETGLSLKKRHTKHVFSHEARNQDGGVHNKHVFFSRKYSFQKLRPLSAEYEEAKPFDIEELEKLSDFHPTYRDYFLEHIRPLLEELEAG